MQKFSKSAISTWLTAAIGTLFIVAFGIYITAEERVNRANEQRITSVELSDELRQSSDDLTWMVRAYVATGNSIYKPRYLEILAIRDGKSPRLPYDDAYHQAKLNIMRPIGEFMDWVDQCVFRSKVAPNSSRMLPPIPF